MSDATAFFALKQQMDYEISHSGKLVTLPEGSGGEIAAGPIEVNVGEANYSLWPDSFDSGGIIAFREDIVNALDKGNIKGLEWHPIQISSVRNRRLSKLVAPTYLWGRITGRIRTLPITFAMWRIPKID